MTTPNDDLDVFEVLKGPDVTVVWHPKTGDSLDSPSEFELEELKSRRATIAMLIERRSQSN